MIKNLAGNLYRSILDDIGIPATLAGTIKTHPALREANFHKPKTANAQDIAQWENLGRSPRGLDTKGTLVGWANSIEGYESTSLQVRSLNKLIYIKRIERFSCDIRDIETLGAAKSDLSAYPDLDSFALARCQEKITDVSPEALRRNLSHDQIRILGENPSDTLSRFSWDGRINLCNEGGAHHFAAARYLSKRMNIAVPITATLIEHQIDGSALDQLLRDFDIFAVGDSRNDTEPYLALQDGLKSLKATYYMGDLPWSQNSQDRHGHALFLPKSDRKSLRVAKILRSEGFTDLGNSLCEHFLVQSLARAQRLDRPREDFGL